MSQPQDHGPGTNPASSTTALAKPAGQKTSKTTRAVLVIVLLIAVAGLGGSAYLWQLHQIVSTQLAQLQNSQADLNNTTSRLTQQITAPADINRRFDELTQQLNTLGSKHESTDQQIAPIRQFMEGGRSTWLLSEAVYLLRMANHALTLRHDVMASRQALELADQNLAEAADPRLLPVRKIIADELVALRGTAVADTEGLSLKITSLIQASRQWPLALGPRVDAPQAEQTNLPRGVANGLIDGIFKSLQEIASGLVVIHRNNEPLANVLTVDQQQILRLHTALQLENARIALLERRPDAYRDQLEQASNNIRHYFDQNHLHVNAALSIIDELRAAPIVVDLPDISGSLRQLRLLQQPSFKQASQGGKP